MINTLTELSTFTQVVLVDVALAGDNAIIVAMAAAGVPLEHRRQVIMLGIAAAVVLRIIFAIVTSHLMALPGVLLIGGLLLLWVCWRLWIEVQPKPNGNRLVLPCCEDEFMYVGHLPLPIGPAHSHHGHSRSNGVSKPKTVSAAIWQITIADVSMSLDNVIAVAGIARDHTTALVFGLVLSVVLMAFGASLIAKWLEDRPWLGFIGVGIIFYVAVDMLWDGIRQLPL